MKHEWESAEIESAIEQLSARVAVRPRPLHPAAEMRILARLERAFENVDGSDLELTEVKRDGVVRRGPATIAAVAAVLVLLSLSAAVLLNNGDSPAKPAANAVGASAVANPLAAVQSELTVEPSVELFRINSDVEAYWRLTTLPEFDGRSFRLPARPLVRIENSGSQQGGRVVRQQIQIYGLTDRMVPAAADVSQVVPNEDMRLNPDTSTLLKLTDLAPGDQFTIVSMQPDATPAALRAAATYPPPDPIFVELPDGLPVDIGDTAADVTAGHSNDFDKMMALQSWFLENFTYSTDVQVGHGTDAIEHFLDVRQGYCEQFASTFAVMARTLGIPSRVAVGYTPGELQPDGRYSVTGANAHAWPEIWFDGIGWIPFEPTPGRELPG